MSAAAVAVAPIALKAVDVNDYVQFSPLSITFNPNGTGPHADYDSFEATRVAIALRKLLNGGAIDATYAVQSEGRDYIRYRFSPRTFRMMEEQRFDGPSGTHAWKATGRSDPSYEVRNPATGQLFIHRLTSSHALYLLARDDAVFTCGADAVITDRVKAQLALVGANAATIAAFRAEQKAQGEANQYLYV